jgi:hypothetical protein
MVAGTETVEEMGTAVEMEVVRATVVGMETAEATQEAVMAVARLAAVQGTAPAGATGIPMAADARVGTETQTAVGMEAAEAKAAEVAMLAIRAMPEATGTVVGRMVARPAVAQKTGTAKAAATAIPMLGGLAAA